MEQNRPIILSIAGLDPSGGAGLLADIKTFEEHKVYGLGIATGQTIQTESKFISIKWNDEKEILAALDTMLSHYTIKAIKIGVVENISRLKTIVSHINEKKPTIKIVWDTVIRSTTGFDFWSGEMNEDTLKEILLMTYLITPNYNEAIKLQPSSNAKEAAKALSAFCNVLLKGGHNQEEKGVDYLYLKTNQDTQGDAVIAPLLRGGVGEGLISPKHGSGCVLSSAIAANLALGFDLRTSCINAKQYIERFLSSNESLLGYHHV
jgi:hydroxymethylpyrimidine/phosphomethylpyrimidine kinase